MRFILPVFVIFSALLSFNANGQQILKEKEFGYNKSLHGFDVPYTLAQEGNQFIMLREAKKNLMILGRYDHYFFKKWERKIKIEIDGSVPQVHQNGDSILVYSIFHNEQIGTLELSFQIFNRHTGAHISDALYNFVVPQNEYELPTLLFNDSFSKFTTLNLLKDGKGYQYSVYQLGNMGPFINYKIPEMNLVSNLASSAHLDERGNFMLTTIDADSVKANVSYWSAHNGAITQIQSKLTLENATDKIDKIDIIRQGASSYFVSISARSGDELSGFSVLGVNVILKYVMFSYHQEFTPSHIKDIYQNYLVTSEEQKMEVLAVPEKLDSYHLIRSFINALNDVILVFEEQELPVTYHQNYVNHHLIQKRLPFLNKTYKAGDIMMFCFSEAGELKWQRVVQKSQACVGNTHGLSFVPQIHGIQLDLFCQEDDKGGDLYVLSFNTINGTLVNKVNLIPDKKFQCVKRYSCWLGPNSLILLGLSPTILNTKTLMSIQY